MGTTIYRMKEPVPKENDHLCGACKFFYICPRAKGIVKDFMQAIKIIKDKIYVYNCTKFKQGMYIKPKNPNPEGHIGDLPTYTTKDPKK